MLSQQCESQQRDNVNLYWPCVLILGRTNAISKALDGFNCSWAASCRYAAAQQLVSMRVLGCCSKQSCPRECCHPHQSYYFIYCAGMSALGARAAHAGASMRVLIISRSPANSTHDGRRVPHDGGGVVTTLHNRYPLLYKRSLATCGDGQARHRWASLLHVCARATP